MEIKDMMELFENRLDTIIVKEKEILNEYISLRGELKVMKAEPLLVVKAEEEVKKEVQKEVVKEVVKEVAKEVQTPLQTFIQKEFPVTAPIIERFTNSEDKKVSYEPKPVRQPSAEYYKKPVPFNISEKPQTISRPYIEQPRKAKKDNAENMFGKNIMGIAASVLIFIGLISLAVLIYDRLPDILRMGMMFAFSGGLAAIGLYLGKKNKNAFSVSLLGCGIGGIYISIIATNVMFHYTSSVAVYLLLLVWVVGILYIADKYEYGNFFRLICQIGVLISLVLSVIAGPTLFEYIMVSIYTMVAFAIIEKSSQIWNIINSIGYQIIAITFACLATMPNIKGGSGFQMEQIPWIRLINIMFFAGFHIFAAWKIKRNRSENEGFHLFTMITITLIYLITIFIALFGLEKINSLYYITAIIVSVCVIAIPAAFSNQIKALQAVILIPSILTLCVMLPILFTEEFHIKHTGLLLIYIPMLLNGFRQKKRFFQVTGFSLIFVDLYMIWMIRLINIEQMPSELLIQKILLIFTLIGILGSMGYMIYRISREREEKTQWIYKLLIYITYNAALLFLLPLIPFSYHIYYSHIICMILNYFIYASGFFCQWDEDFKFFPKDRRKYLEQVSDLTRGLVILGNILFIYGVWILFYMDLRVDVHIAFVLVTGLYGIMDIKDLYDRYRTASSLGFFIGMKVTLFVFAVIYSVFDIMKYPYLVSILLILIACICIYIGFAKKFTSFRIYGLMITLASVFKLVTYDIQELNSIIRVLAFIVGGLLCFAISRVYNNANKKIEGVSDAET